MIASILHSHSHQWSDAMSTGLCKPWAKDGGAQAQRYGDPHKPLWSTATNASERAIVTSHE